MSGDAAKILNVPIAGKSYDIVIGSGLLLSGLERVSALIRKGEKTALISDENVWQRYGYAVETGLNALGIATEAIVLPPGEKTKDIGHLSLVYDRMAAAGITRKGCVIALGGGVVGDLSGFAAATYMRGVDFIQIPTTLLAQVDSSVGGKTAVDIAAGKNLVGAFYQPRLVLIDPDVLTSLPPREFAAGMAEVIKYGAIASPSLFALLEQTTVPSMTEIICSCCAIKSDIVAEDEFDNGHRAILNFGHTFGHAIEKRYGFSKYNHGEAVAAGMRIAAHIGEKIGMTAPGTAARLGSLLDRYGLTATESPVGLIEHIKSDKKGEAGGVNLVLLKALGAVVCVYKRFEELEVLLDD
ncbi:MAG: 3-dehydroquinate synthase [Clostridiales Family XIII bacterium]|jgi:3-dehydroquinate synthase|nr:3-dehydroquinate synthase [Clostridiales Family XIII bacterium]